MGKTVLGNKGTAAAKKKEVIQGILGEGPATNFCNLVIDDNRAQLIRDAIEVFDKQYNLNEKIVVATVTSACELDEDTQLQIAKTIQESAKCKSVKIKPVIDTSVIGGYMVDIGGKRIDLSLRSKLKAMERELTKGAESGIGAMMNTNLDFDKLLPTADSLMPSQAIR